MPKTVMHATAGHRIVEWGRPAVEVSLREQIDRGGQLNYIESRPGSEGFARCSCGEKREGAEAEVFDWMRGHDDRTKS